MNAGFVGKIIEKSANPPWICKGRTYVAGAGILVVVDGELAIDGIETKETPGVTEYSVDILSEARGEFVVPDWNGPHECIMRQCWACDGAGEMYATGVCPVCDGAGEIALVGWGGGRVSLSHVMLLQKLPGLRVDSKITNPHPLAFIAEGLRGIVAAFPM